MKKAVFIDHKSGELKEEVFDRIADNFDETEFALKDDKDILHKVKNADAFFVKIFTKVDRELIDATPDLKYIGVCSTAFDAIDAKYAREKGIDVCNLGGYSTESVAEFFFAALMEQTRELEKAKAQARKENFGLNAETKGIISKEKIALIKKDCVFINLSPPHLIDERAIMDAAKKGKLTFIFDHSDDTELAKEFLATPNCVTYPPVAFRTKQADINKWETFAGNIEKFVSGNPQNVVN